MSEIISMGEAIVEFIRDQAGLSFDKCGCFIGPFPSGSPAIFADAVAKMGHASAIIGGIGDDDFGRCFLNKLNNDGVSCKHIKVEKNRTTGVAFATYYEDGSREFIFHFDKTPVVMAELNNPEATETPVYFHLMGCSLMINDNFMTRIIDTALSFVSKGAKLTLDPNIRNNILHGRNIPDILAPILEHCSIFFPGLNELQMVTGIDNLHGSIAKLWDKYPKMELIVVKMGSKGSAVFNRDAGFFADVYDIIPVDPTGAGDNYDAGFLCGLLDGKPLTECAQLASAAAALCAKTMGPMESVISDSHLANMISSKQIIHR